MVMKLSAERLLQLIRLDLHTEVDMYDLILTYIIFSLIVKPISSKIKYRHVKIILFRNKLIFINVVLFNSKYL